MWVIFEGANFIDKSSKASRSSVVLQIMWQPKDGACNVDYILPHGHTYVKNSNGDIARTPFVLQ